MRTRVLIPEQMDDPNLDRSKHEQALRGLQRINAWTRNASLVWKHVLAVAANIGDQPLRILDLATGSADIPISLMKLASSRGIALQIDACDVSEQAISVATKNCHAASVEVCLFCLDILRDEIPEQYDVVMCSQFLHHLTEKEAVSVLRKMKSAATRRVVVVDLERNRMNWLQVWFATRILTRSDVVHFDGPQSIRAAFTCTECYTLAQQAGFTNLTIQRQWPCRFVLVGAIDGTD
ncbi:MAG: methyltransferase domain-containing protein [Planctomycetaceae bacterium]|nr:methyltransferase domain-containing protein [Planctomycetales bacterium]MCB9924487.1 methyltransferase domain-containing protein [Planctomycetaceae bacterium]